MKLSMHALTCRLGPLAIDNTQRLCTWNNRFSGKRSFVQSSRLSCDIEISTAANASSLTPTDGGAPLPNREFMTFTDKHIQEFIRHLHLTANVSKKMQRSSLPAIKCSPQGDKSGTLKTTEEQSTQKPKPPQDTLMPLQEIMPGVLEGLETSYKFQNRVIQTMKTQGIDVIAWRVAGTNSMFLRQWGIKSPLIAPVFATMLYKDDEEISINKHRIMYLEVNFAFRLGKPMKIDDVAPTKEAEPSNVSEEEEKPLEVPIDTILSYIDAFYPVIDFTSSRYPVRAPHSSALVADLVGGAAVAMGEPISVEKWKEHSMADHPCVLFLEDDPIATGKGDVVLGNPLRGIPYVAKNFHFTRSTKVLEKGTIVLTGPCTTTLPIKSGKYTAHFGPLGKVSIHVNE